VFAGPAHVCLVSCFCFGIGKVFSANLSSKADPSFAFTLDQLPAEKKLARQVPKGRVLGPCRITGKAHPLSVVSAYRRR